jgi:DNA-binding transcriptional ArsR family regulator
MTSKERRRAGGRALRAHPVRDQIVDVMRSYGKPISPTQLSRITGGTLGSVAYHVRTLVAAGVVELADEGRVRGAVEHFYALALDARARDELRKVIKKLQPEVRAIASASTARREG